MENPDATTADVIIQHTVVDSDTILEVNETFLRSVRVWPEEKEPTFQAGDTVDVHMRGSKYSTSTRKIEAVTTSRRLPLYTGYIHNGRCMLRKLN